MNNESYTSQLLSGFNSEACANSCCVCCNTQGDALSIKFLIQIIDDSLTDEAISKASRWNCSNMKTRKTTAVCFKQDGHYLQKHKAKYLADVIRNFFSDKSHNHSLNLEIS